MRPSTPASASTVTQAAELDELSDWVTEQGNPRNGRRVELVEVGLPSPILEQGIVLVDTPGMGGLGAGHAAVTLGFLPFADGVIFVSDASSELTAPELEFLARASELCPTVLFARTKIDLYAGWERIAELDREHLRRLGLELPTVGVSSTVRYEALLRRDRHLNERSHFPDLIAGLISHVIDPARAGAQERAAHEGRSITAQLRSTLETERALLDDRSGLQATLAELEAATARLEHLKGPASRWSIVVSDRVSDLSNEVTHRFRGAMRTISRQTDERIESLRRGDAWDQMVRDLQTQVADEVTNAFERLEHGRAAIRAEVLELLVEEGLDGDPTTPLAATGDLRELWRGTEVADGGSTTARALRASLTGLRGAQGGILMFGMMSQFLPAAVATLIVANPVLLGIGALFGGIGLADERKRRVLQQRQTARSQARQFLDEVQFEVGNQLSNAVRDIQRELRDEFGARLTELQRTYTDAARRAQHDAQRTDQQRQARAAEIDGLLAELARIDDRLGATP